MNMSEKTLFPIFIGALKVSLFSNCLWNLNLFCISRFKEENLTVVIFIDRPCEEADSESEISEGGGGLRRDSAGRKIIDRNFVTSLRNSFLEKVPF